MKKSFIKFGFVLVLTFSVTSIVRAEIMVGTSLEWLTCKSDIIAVGMLERKSQKRGNYSVIYENYVLKVLESIKGDKNQTEIPFSFRTLSNVSSR